MNNLLKIISFMAIIGLLAGIVSAGPQFGAGLGGLNPDNGNGHYWFANSLPPATIYKNSEDVIVYYRLDTWCRYPSTLSVSEHNEFELFFERYSDGRADLKIKEMDEGHVGQHTPTVYCNGEPLQFILNIVNRNPYITSLPIVTASVGERYTYNVVAEDDDEGDVVSYSLGEHPAGMRIDENDGRVTWTPLQSQVGDNTVVINVDDNSDGKTTQSYSISVGDVPEHYPIILSTPVEHAIVDKLYVYGVVAEDSDEGDVVSYALGNHPAGMRIDARSGFVTWVPSEVGVYGVVVKALDLDNHVTEQSFTITVNAAAFISKKMPRRIVHVDRLTTIGEYFKAGQDVPVYINFKNEDNYDLKNAKITSVITELGVRRAVGPFKLEKGDEITKRIFLELPVDAAPGEYNIRTTISNYNGVKRIKYRTIIVK